MIRKMRQNKGVIVLGIRNPHGLNGEDVVKSPASLNGKEQLFGTLRACPSRKD
jgi:hypothetical protein